MQGQLKRWDWLTGDRPTTWFLKETCSHAPWDCRLATQANGGSIREPKRPCQTCTNNILPASWLCPGFRVCVGGLQGQYLATRETAKLRGSILGLQPKRPGLGKIQGTFRSAFDSSACESVFWLKPTSTPHVQPSPGPVSAQQENSGRSQSPDCLITSVLTSWVSLLYVPMPWASCLHYFLRLQPTFPSLQPALYSVLPFHTMASASGMLITLTLFQALEIAGFHIVQWESSFMPNRNK